MYVLLKSSSLWSVSVLDNASGQLLREIQSMEATKVSKCKIFAVQNRLFIVEKSTYSGLNSVCVKLYEDELLCKTVQTTAQSVYDVIVTSDYIIQTWGAEKITIKSIENDESFDRVVFLDGVNAIYDTVWVPDISCRTSGYLFVSYYHNVLRMKVFHVDLDNVNNHETLQSLLNDTSVKRNLENLPSNRTLCHEIILLNFVKAFHIRQATINIVSMRHNLKKIVIDITDINCLE